MVGLRQSARVVGLGLVALYTKSDTGRERNGHKETLNEGECMKPKKIVACNGMCDYCGCECACGNERKVAKLATAFARYSEARRCSVT